MTLDGLDLNGLSIPCSCKKLKSLIHILLSLHRKIKDRESDFEGLVLEVVVSTYQSGVSTHSH